VNHVTSPSRRELFTRQGRRLLVLCAISFSTGASAFGDTPAAAGITALPGALPDAGSSVLRVFGALILVIAIFLGGVWLFRNWQRFTLRKGGAPRLNVIEVRSLGQRHALYVVGYDQQRMLLASSPAGVTLVSHLPEAEQNEAPAAAPQASFAEAFQQLLQRKA
jgi:flagellar protein FliO/FliZ